ncbi:bacteriocin [Streptococcus ruminantium]|uniref:Bacteriocin n=1 Tax=Streptococcus ruminantium TaxID=1917441 RepID=A0ABU1B690_9STRE|nr:bacteriocin [Streptococcus ruminantium]QHF54690.1 bacteriocin [Streptococcus sp. DAT741]MDQ8758852.1 bacteriocin [Streptococcus ruminantium]MDQ8768231.1 bacteriocin [Streptococcus ruminantium]MDQ8774690.1 bacteriocin [Streptococcus ruminantium]MDQ8793598.1 bacteriocin [Streptococcus ruminantium]
MQYVFPIVIFIFQVYLIYLSTKGSDKNSSIVEITTLNSFFILFLIYDKLIFLFIGYIALIIFVLGHYKRR